MQDKKSRITSWLENVHPVIFNTYAIIAAFSAYFAMYAFRKPFSVGKFDGVVDIFGMAMDYKVILIISQVLGYTLSKFLGIKVVSETKGSRRGITLLALIVFAELALLMFGFLPRPWGILCLFLNGLPLGMVWGMLFGFLEGRKTSELLGAGMSASYILASGVVKSVGKNNINMGISEQWMPFATGMMFLPVFFIAVYLLTKLPKPNKEDVALKVKRAPMNGSDRWEFFKTYSKGLIPLTFLYMLLTAFRDFRDNFAREIWDSLGFQGKASIYTLSEIPIIVIVLLSLALLFLIKDNKKAMRFIHYIMITGTVLIGVSTLAFQMEMIGPATWMILVGLGLYLGYVPYGCVLFDRLIAAVGFVGTAGFMIYMTDAFGYLGSVGLMLFKTFGNPDISWLDFFIKLSYATSILCTSCFLVSYLYFEYKVSKVNTRTKHDQNSDQDTDEPEVLA
ncbi:hypothetical protein A9Q84_01490 [Halobacteriovorax marinus]|uniref:MFS transporter n=1 Tax=Halobacteriovorax marinus TaxID=97084 RepID=A0A1Y5FHQ9_9BACT|nr:hypothetical protein A9Q84_01490 [Halobacteriovorax marinus]